RALGLELGERVNGKGEVRAGADPAELESIKEAFEAAGVAAVAVCFLHSYSNPAHERVVAEWLAGAMPDVSVSISSEVAPEIREDERMSTRGCNRHVHPTPARHLGVHGAR